MEKQRIVRPLRLLGIAGLLVLTLTTWQFMAQPHTAHAAAVPNTVFLDTSSNNPIPVKTTQSSGTISYTITDFTGKQVGSGGPLTVSNGQATVTLPQEPDGYYLLNVTDNTVSPAVTQQISFTMVAPFTTPANSPFGAETHFRDGMDPNLDPVITTLGIGNIREDMTWQVVEATPGVYNFSSTDPWMTALQQNGLNPLLILDYNNTNYDGGQTPYDTAGYTAFANFAKAVVTHYPQLKMVEVYNEYTGFASGPCAGSAACYATLLQYTYQAVKAVRPSVTVIGGSTGGLDLNWETSLFQAGGLHYLDALSIHPYTAGQAAAPETGPIDQEVIATENLIRQDNNGYPKPIWITELGWPTCCSRVDEPTQAAYVVRSAALALAGGTQKFFLYASLDGGTDPNYTEDHFGVVRLPDPAGSYTPKPSYTAYAVMARQLANETFETAQNQNNGVYDEVFSQNGSDNLRVLWTTAGSTNITLSASSALTVVSMMGTSQTVQPVNGQVTLTLSGNPIYVQGAATAPGLPIITNPGFERGSTSGWSTSNGATVVNANQYSGNYAMQLGTNNSAAEQTVTGLTPNTVYILCGWAKVATAGEVVRVAGVKYYGGTEENVVLTSTSYQQGCSTFTTGATNTSAYIYCYKDPGGSGVAYCDDYTLKPQGLLITNPGFETGSASGWSPYNGATVVNANQHSGNYAMQLGTNNSGADQTVTGLTPNTVYILCGWAKVATAGEVVKVAGVKYYGGTEENVVLTSTSYQQGCSTFTTGATNTSAYIYCYKDPGGSGVAYCDDYTLKPQGLPLITNPGFETGSASGWSTSNGATVVNANQHSGNYAMQLGASGSGADQTVTGLAPNTSYVLCGWAKVAIAGEVVKVAGVKYYGGTEENVVLTSTSYQQGCSTFTTGATNTSADIYCYKDPGGSGVAYCDDYILEPQG